MIVYVRWKSGRHSTEEKMPHIIIAMSDLLELEPLNSFSFIRIKYSKMVENATDTEYATLLLLQALVISFLNY